MDFWLCNKPGSGSKERLSCSAARKLSFPDRRMATPQFSEEQMVYIQEHFVPRPATSSVATTYGSREGSPEAGVKTEHDDTNDPSPPVPPTAGTSTVSGELGRATATASLLGFS